MVATRAGWLYVAVLLDLYSRRVIGWAMSHKPDQQLTLEALAMATRQRRVVPGADSSLRPRGTKLSGVSTAAHGAWRHAQHESQRELL